MSVQARKRLFTVEEFHRMGEAGILDHDARLELLGGEIFEMPPIGGWHARGVAILDARLGRALGDRAIIWPQNPVVLDDYSEPLPDLAVLKPRDDFYLLKPRPADVLLIIEVSDTSLQRDREVKLAYYAACGIPEVWILDRAGRRIEAHREPSGSTYAVTTVHLPGDTISPAAFPDVDLDVAEIVG